MERMVLPVTKSIWDSMRKALLVDHSNNKALMVKADQTMTNRGIIMVSEAIECEAVAQCMLHVFVKRFMMINY